MNPTSHPTNPRLPPMAAETEQDLVDTEDYDVFTPPVDATDTASFVVPETDGTLSNEQLPATLPASTSSRRGPALLLATAAACLAIVILTGLQLLDLL